MNNKHRKTLEAVFAKPTRANIDFHDMEKLLIAVGGILIEGDGSRIRFAFGEKIVSFHRPHPEKEAKRYQIETVREVLEGMGVKP